MNAILSIVSTILQVIGLILFKLYGWVLIVVALLYMIWQNKRKVTWVQQTENVLLQVEVPKDNEKKELSAEQMFASLHGILRSKSELVKEGSLQEHVSFEIAAKDNQIQFYVWVPKHLKDFVEGQIYAQYPSVRIKEFPPDYADTEVGERAFVSTELSLTKNEVLPIKTFPSFEVDPLAGITAVMAKLEQPGEEMWVQILARPVDDSWHELGLRYIDEVKSGKRPTWGKALTGALLQLPTHILSNFIGALAKAPEAPKEAEKKKELSTGQQAVIKAVEGKIAKLGYDVKIRIAYLGPDAELGKQRMQAIVGGFKQFNTTNLNGFSAGKTSVSHDGVNDYRARLFLDQGLLLNIEELASLYHPPHKSVETPNMVWSNTKTGEPPANLPTEVNTAAEDVSLFGITNFRGRQLKFGLKRRDRGRHLYVIGQTGVGKSFLLELLSLSDLYHNQGIAIIDPHGDFATDMMRYIPEHRLKDVIYFNPSDTQFPVAFNPMELSDPNFKSMTASELVGVMKRLFESWGPRLEYILRMTILALLDYPDATMLGITRMLTEKEFRKKVVREIKDPIVRQFWVNEFASWNDKFANEAVAPVLNKVGAFTTNPVVRNIVGQPKSAINLRQVMDEGKILVVNLSRGLIGEDNAAILGALMVTKLQLAAMSRADVDLAERRPFYLYVDEFQNFATDSFAVILSEARKYGLFLTVANQYISQMPDTVKDAVFGNVGSMITFRIGAGDGNYIGKYFEPVFEAGDLVKLNNQHFLVSMSIDGEKSVPFSGITLRMPEPIQDYTEHIIQASRQSYASPAAEVESAISDWTDPSGQAARNAEPSHEQKPNILSDLKNPGQPAQHPQQPAQQGRGEAQIAEPTQVQEQNPNAEMRPNEHLTENQLEAGQSVSLRK